MLSENYEGFKQKEDELKQSLKDAMGQSVKGLLLLLLF